ncbi:MAG: ribonuclease Z [Candidatus Woesearchaeota archaeon]|jgi:ribonuclease Z|nr:ribonuclease Z [Candidatus Woesearchaeota archaeon]|tara:strand:+ start:462 stop:1355 length:894 start_codon:yes stop_codon:yes gene_type:complete
MVEITFLGTSSMVPTKERNQSAVLISYKSEGILIDCGDGTQRQFKIANIPLTKVTKILITHWHGDHTLGLPGLIQSLSASEYTKTLEIYGPKGTKQHFEHMFKAFVFDRNMELVIHEIKPGTIFENDDFSIEALELEHGVKTFGFNFIEKDKRRINVSKTNKLGIPEGPLLGKLQQNKTISWKGKKVGPSDTTYIVQGKKIALISDTLPCNNCNKLAKDADVLICEATYHSDLEKKAETHNHMTAKQAALIANRADAKKLVLTHFSARYKDLKEIEEDAKDYFDNVVYAYDLLKIKL